MPSVPSRNKTLVLVVKISAKKKITRLSCPVQFCLISWNCFINFVRDSLTVLQNISSCRFYSVLNMLFSLPRKNLDLRLSRLKLPTGTQNKSKMYFRSFTLNLDKKILLLVSWFQSIWANISILNLIRVLHVLRFSCCDSISNLDVSRLK